MHTISESVNGHAHQGGINPIEMFGTVTKIIKETLKIIILTEDA